MNYKYLLIIEEKIFAIYETMWEALRAGDYYSPQGYKIRTEAKA